MIIHVPRMATILHACGPEEAVVWHCANHETLHFGCIHNFPVCPVDIVVQEVEVDEALWIGMTAEEQKVYISEVMT